MAPAKGGGMMADFRPGLWPTLISLLAVSILIGLGVWQIERLQWKQALIADLETRTSAPAIDLPSVIDDPLSLRYRRVRISGLFDHERELPLVYGRGYHIVTPFYRKDGPPLLVVRGFVPKDKRSPATRAEGQIRGPVSLEGIVRLAPERNGFEPENDPARNIWYSRDLDAMASAAGLRDAAPVFVELVADAPGGWPKGGVTRLSLPNNHLSYAVTWFALAVALAVIFVLFGLRRGCERS